MTEFQDDAHVMALNCELVTLIGETLGGETCANMLTGHPAVSNICLQLITNTSLNADTGVNLLCNKTKWVKVQARPPNKHTHIY